MVVEALIAWKWRFFSAQLASVSLGVLHRLPSHGVERARCPSRSFWSFSSDTS